MLKPLFTAAALAATLPLQAAPTLAEHGDKLLEADTIAWDFTAGITTEVGPRQAGTEAEKRGRDWAVKWLDKADLRQNVAVWTVVTGILANHPGPIKRAP